MEKILNNLSDTEQLTQELVGKLKPGQVVAFYGDLGSGKTTLIQLIAKELGVTVPVTSPTFVIQKNYPVDNFEIVHIDCYRFNNLDDAQGLGFEELFADTNKLILIEWANKIESLLPEDTIRIKLNYLDNNKRQIEIDNLSF